MTLVVKKCFLEEHGSVHVVLLFDIHVEAFNGGEQQSISHSAWHIIQRLKVESCQMERFALGLVPNLFYVFMFENDRKVFVFVFETSSAR